MTDEKAYKRRWYLANRERVLARVQQYNEDNPEKRKDIQARNYQKRRDVIALQHAEKAPHYRDYKRTWRADNPGYDAEWMRNKRRGGKK
ncbi:MAG: hypothetical protein AB7O04_01640 [Hyphomonadaceae bacterium]